ncbi:MAG: LacI family DNA-binding transcriptional regulator [Lentisphaeria bacterium]|nr:LacI family DNA-binding transcriptional regulator [Lentisphaeria bacterium]
MSTPAQHNQNRISIKELASRLGTSVCTVSKALHNKPKISDEMREKVLALASQLGYAPNIAASSMARKHLRIAWIYPSAWPSYHQTMLNGAINRTNTLRDFNISVHPFVFDDFINPAACLKAIADAVESNSDAIVICPGSYTTKEQKILEDELSRIELPVIFIAGNEIKREGKLCIVRQHSLKCGEIAGNLAAIILAGRKKATAGLIIGSTAQPDHRNKIKGFQTMLKRGNVDFAGFAQSLDIPERAYEETKKLVEQNPNIALLYIGTENIQGTLDYLAEKKLLGKIKIIATGTSDPVNKGLKEGYIQFELVENPFYMGAAAIDAACRKLFHNQDIAGKIYVPPSIRISCLMDAPAEYPDSLFNFSALSPNQGLSFHC